MTQMDAIAEHRPLLFGIAYRMLGSTADAEDAVQETFLRWHRVLAEGTEVQSPKAWLAQTVTRICLDELKSARVRREQYVGPWLPEPLVAGAEPDVAEAAGLADTVSTAFLVLLETLTPKERAVFLLHDVFGYDYAAIAGIVGESEAYCRQLAKRARAHVEARRPRFTASPEQQERLTERFLHAVTEGDLPSLIDSLAKDVTVWSDGGGKVNAARKPVLGREKVARFFLGLMRNAPDGLAFRVTRVNGQPGIVTYADGQPRNVVTLDVADDGIRAFYIVVNPDKLRSVPPLAEGTGLTVPAQPVRPSPD